MSFVGQVSISSIEDLKALIRSDTGLSTLLNIVEKRILELSPEDRDPGHDLAHFLRVAFWTLRIGCSENPEFEKREAVAAALLHDIVNVPKISPLRKDASRLCSEEAERIVTSQSDSLGFSKEAMVRIRDAVRCHSFSRGEMPATLLGRALQDADRLEALGAIGIMRCFSTGARMGTDYFHSEDPWALHRPLEDRRYSVDHFFTKLLKLPETMLTESGRAEALRRAATLSDFLERLGEELGASFRRPIL